MIFFLRGISRLGSPKTSLLQKINSILPLGKIDPLFGWATSIPRKYFRVPRSLISNALQQCAFHFFIASTSSPVRTMSSTYTTRTVVPSFLFLTNREWSAWLLWKPNSCTALLNFLKQASLLVNGLLQSIYSLLQSTYFPFLPLWYESRCRKPLLLYSPRLSFIRLV